MELRCYTLIWEHAEFRRLAGESATRPFESRLKRAIQTEFSASSSLLHSHIIIQHHLAWSLRVWFCVWRWWRTKSSLRARVRMQSVRIDESISCLPWLLRERCLSIDRDTCSDIWVCVTPTILSLPLRNWLFVEFVDAIAFEPSSFVTPFMWVVLGHLCLIQLKLDQENLL